MNMYSYSKEHLTMEAYTLLPAFIKSLRFSKDDNDKELFYILLEVYELLGRYTPCLYTYMYITIKYMVMYIWAHVYIYIIVYT